MIPAIAVIPKSFEKPILYGVLLGGALLAFTIYRKGIAGTTGAIAGGLVKGVTGAVVGIAGGIVTASGELVVNGYNALPNEIKPTSSENYAYTTTNKIGASITGDKNFNLGGWIYDITH